MKRKQLVALGVFCACISGSGYAQRSQSSSALTPQSLLVIGKASGACGILNLQLQFQENTNMTGGDDFIVRFWKTEAARLGMTIKDYQAQCQRTISGYDKLWQMSEEIEKSERR